jgi:hypothetical protein
VLALAAALFGTLAAPSAYAVETASVPHTGSIPLAGPATAGGGGPGGGFRTMTGGGPGQGTTGAAANGTGAATNGTGEATGGTGAVTGGAGAVTGGAPSGQEGGLPSGGGAPTGDGAPTGGETAAGGQEGDLGGQTRRTGGFGGGMGEQADSAVTQLLASGADGYRWVAVVGSAQSAASLELASGGLPVMALGGFTGSDEVLTLAQFKQYVAEGKIHYYLRGGGARGGPGGGQGGGQGANAQIASWVEQTFTSVTVGSQTVYDLTKSVASAVPR